MKRKKPIDWARFRRGLRVALVAVAVLLVIGMLALWQLWQNRAATEDLGWPVAAVVQESVIDVADESAGSVTATWLGVSTILFEDGETQILIDGAFTRLHPLKVLLQWPVRSDVAMINYALASHRINRLAAIVPVHSHFDHAIDVGHVANRSSALVIGSESTANIVRGARLPVAQYQILADGESRQFGDFTVRLVASRHSPIGFGDQEIFPGVIAEPLSQPASASAYRTGVAWSIFVSHPRGTTLVQGSAGFIEDKLAGESADVVMLCLSGLEGLGNEYTGRYWHETVTATGAGRVIPIHFDDFMAPFGEVRLLPRFIDDVSITAGWIDTIREETAADVSIELPVFGQPIPLY